MPWRGQWEEIQLLPILDLDTRWGVSGQHHGLAALYPQGEDPWTHWIGGWVGLKTGLDTETINWYIRNNLVTKYNIPDAQ
jgi:hypothetical protein